jgi:hypothetical protein
MIAPFHYLPPLFRFTCNLDKAIALAAKVKGGRKYLPIFETQILYRVARAFISSE